MEKNWHSLAVKDCFSLLESSPAGLTDEQVQERRATYGLNQLADGKKVSLLTVFFNQFRDFMIVVLIAATLVSGLLGEYTDAITIIAIIILNGVLGFVQEVRAERSLSALKELTAPMARVRRNGQVVQLPAKELVPGDVILLEGGDRVPADGRVASAMGLDVEESALTGESVPVSKQANAYVDPVSNLGDRINMVYMGTMVTRGKAEVLVTETGMQTEMGKIADLMEQSEEALTPLQQRLDQLGKVLVWLALGITLLVVVAGVLHGHKLYEMFLAGVSLAVAAIPEGLPAIVTIALALGVQRMIRRNAIVRKLPSVETLGCATVICSDKTGTLTQNRMTVQRVWADGDWYRVSGSGYDPIGDFVFDDHPIQPLRRPALKTLIEIGAVCNNAVMKLVEGTENEWQVQGDPTEGALLVMAKKAGLDDPDAEFERIDELPFDSDRKLMSVLVRRGDEWFLFVKGAPDVLLERSTLVVSSGKEVPMSSGIRKRILDANQQMAHAALRNLAFGYRKFPSPEAARAERDPERDLVFVGLAGMMDPPREEVFDAIETCHRAGIRTVMITGDHPETAIAIAKQLNILPEGGTALTGAQLEQMSEEELAARVQETFVYARVTPEHKLKIVRALQARGEVVAMTGDGVNDAPAIKQADIGISMGMTGTDVAKEASALVLADDNFATIVAAVEEGRGIYDNIKKFIRYLLASNVGEILTMFVAMLAGLPLPLLPIQILWVNLVTDGLPAIALGVDPAEKDMMDRPPRNVNEGIFARGFALKIMSRGVLIGFVTLAVFVWSLKLNPASLGDLGKAQTMAYATLTMAQFILVFDCRSVDGGIFKRNFFENKWLLLAVGSSVALFLLTMYIPSIAAVFKTVALGGRDWLVVLIAAAIPTFTLSLRRAGRKALRPRPAARGIPIR
ncbi:calcium-translocating P-type ATPase, SERCA-type [Alicyclobacillus cycloheptanicus]|uniref:Ca2+-transporting ATPase n=1 Tax=Alicyclobacillus cycloheptanicus TaxID=1457 RepID=A0ABT9XKK1_9BACL|nr:calcium-translocating P-type ATPase, SERCA-type [Alicyclobacillus cycloheptanicus]MDQ0190824.1 Ca2+-transporting ATPase [Alicyclobacillus cycloheptanicus]WDM01475.1 calcium-translocating P-type ATPase, SERCA-type [Alicyclobacillus cycloheptanicus]